MLLVRHIKYLLTLTSKLEVNDTVIALLNQIDKFTKRNSQLAEQLSLVTEQNSLLADQNTQLQKENAALAQRVSKLERSKGLNSGNSSKPPSSDGLKKPPAKANRRTQSRRNTSNRKSGGQPGHKGTTLKQVKKPDKVMNHFPPQCQECEAILSPGDSMKSSNRQVFDLPPPPPLVVTEHRAHTCQCHHCGTQTRAVFPENVTAPVQYGDEIAAHAVYFQTYHCIPEKRLSQIFLDIYGFKITSATLARKIAKKARAMFPFTEVVKDSLSGDETAVKNMDETGLRVEGKTRWVHVLCSIALSHFRLGASRGDMLQDLLGTVVHDCFSSNWTLKGVKHGVCNAHTLRELEAVIEFDKEPWASVMKPILLDGKKLRDIARIHGQVAVAPEEIREVERRFDVCCEKALAFYESQPDFMLESAKKKSGPIKRSVGHNLLLRFMRRKSGILLFLHDLTVPFTNNEAERDLRMTKVRQKVSGCFRTEEGAENFCILRTVIVTAQKQGWNIMQTLKTAPDQLIQMLKAS